MSRPHLPFLEFLSGELALDNAPVLCDDKSVTWLRYGELRESVQKLTPSFRTPTQEQQHGLILCAVPLTISGVTAYLGAIAAGHAVLMINTDTVRPDQFITQYEPEWIILASPYKPDGPYLPVDFPLSGLFLWQRTLPAQCEIHKDLFLLLLPPGPPESCKTVRLSYNSVAHNTRTTIEAISYTNEERPLLNMPLAYSFGLSLLHMALAVGGSLVLSQQDIKSKELWDLSQKHDATLFAGVPFHYEYLSRADIDNLHVPRLKTFLQAGGRMPNERTAEILRQVATRNGALYIMYGLTEASPRISSLPLHLHPDKIGSSGKPLRDGLFSVIDGQLIYKGPNVMMGYAENRTDLAKGDTQHDVLIINEPFHFDNDGYLFFES